MKPATAMTTDELKNLVIKNIGKINNLPEDELMFYYDCKREWINREGIMIVSRELKNGFNEKRKLETGK